MAWLSQAILRLGLHDFACVSVHKQASRAFLESSPETKRIYINTLGTPPATVTQEDIQVLNIEKSTVAHPRSSF